MKHCKIYSCNKITYIVITFYSPWRELLDNANCTAAEDSGLPTKTQNKTA